MGGIRFVLVHPDQVRGDVVALTPAQTHYVRRVLRRKTGDPLRVVVANEGLELRTRLPACSEEETALAVDSSALLPARSAERLTLGVGMVKGEKLDDVVRHATELGLDGVAVIRAMRSVPDAPERALLRRLRTIVWNSCQQSGNPYVPAIERFGSVTEYVDHVIARGDQIVMAVAHGGEGLSGVRIERGASYGLLIGPEGDFTREEVERVCRLGGQIVSLPRYVLRTQTACVVLATLVLDRMGRFG